MERPPALARLLLSNAAFVRVPNRVLAAATAVLAPGRYQVHWHVKSVPAGDFANGFIAFTVTR